ncbi:hypothetical protein MPTK1_1g27110 [Marchantia polymorpha subsp. ruderalis]|uniref:Uncharacterized protein n=1 Tax=Marchantia polymorpha subsp. ruderalis TaxID=1480154 RepID=A0AAF6AUR8_MARPO|nr:hypothetical protein Mp_1g27110 [Marchantia polymorpha subsp. ruderalis]
MIHNRVLEGALPKRSTTLASIALLTTGIDIEELTSAQTFSTDESDRSRLHPVGPRSSEPAAIGSYHYIRAHC